ncbi:hypothetical protein MKI84_10920 [Ancylobacter sp. A5.8]|uniref:hypothetical protein n=1 Tax=Ancylobacter gelatini TaxID=2919920 RepID=UPI001F4E4616|nr:hypothetical protein [Ancylobacter gelatini]MCJ8143426.1 hypothetical protein [Ancylobacter gelatini]
MKALQSFSLPMALLLAMAAGAPALAQDLPPGGGNGGSLGPALPDPNILPPPEGDPIPPAPMTGETVPPPGPPPEGSAARIKLPDCAPPNCGTPQIMAE